MVRKERREVMIIASSKGQIGFENAWLVISVFIVGVGLIFGISALTDLNTDIQSDLDLSTEAKAASEQVVGNAPSNFDNLFLFLVIGLWGVLLVGAWASASNPIFTFIAIILGVLGLVVTLFVGNVYAEMSSDDELNDFGDNFPKMNWILNNILILAVFITFSVILVLYATNS